MTTPTIRRPIATTADSVGLTPLAVGWVVGVGGVWLLIVRLYHCETDLIWDDSPTLPFQMAKATK